MSSVEDLYRKNNAFLEGHFLLSSGMHSDKYLQSALVLQNPPDAETLGKQLADLFKDSGANVVVSPALGGLIIGHEVARASGVRFIFTEKDDKGRPVLRRNFELSKKDKALIIEDVITTGLSTNEVKKVVEAAGATLVGVGCIVNRSGLEFIPGLEPPWNQSAKNLMFLKVKTMAPNDCDLCKANVPIVKPGSRKQ